MNRFSNSAALLAVVSLAACVGDIGGTLSGDEPATATAKAGLGPAPLRRLNNVEYDNTVRALLRIDASPSSVFAADELLGNFDNMASAQTVSSLQAEQY